MSLVSQNSRRRRGGRANARKNNGKGHPAAVPGPDVPRDRNDPKILQGLRASEGPGTPREGPSASVPPTTSEGSRAPGQFTISEGPNTSEPPTSRKGRGASRPPAVSAGLNTAVSITASEGPSSPVPPTAPKGSKAYEHLTVAEGLAISEQRHSDGDPNMEPTLGEGPGISVPPTFSEESGISVPLPSDEGLSIFMSPTISEGPGINVPYPASEDPSTSVPPTDSNGLGINLPPTFGEGLSISMLFSALEEPDIFAPPPSAEGLFTAMSPPSGDIQSSWVPPIILEGCNVNVPPTAPKGLRTSVPSAACESISAEGLSTSMSSISAEGFCSSLAPCSAEGSCELLPCGEGPSLGEGSSTSQMPLAAEGPSASGMPTEANNPEEALSCCASERRNKSTSRALQKAKDPSVRPKREDRFLDFQVLRDSKNSNSITIMGLGTSRVALTLKPQDPMEQNVAELLQFLLLKDQTKYPIKESDMREFIDKDYRHQFPEILRRAAVHLECIFRFELKELDPEEHIYILLNKLGPVPFEGLEDVPNGPKMGLLMMILGHILLNGNQAREADIWEMLWRFGVQRERRLSVFGNVKRLLSVEFVWQRYLDYRPLTDCVPVEFEFYWGPRSRAETTKMKILKFMAKIYNKDPMDWPALYNEALEEDADRVVVNNFRVARPFRRPLFAEVSPDLDASGSKYSPHSWPESRLESKSRKLVQLFLLMDSTKLPIPKKGILYYIGRECTKVFPDLLNRAARTLNHVYGTELVVLDPRNHSYTLYNRREMEDTEEIMDSPNRPGNNFLMQVLSFIFIMGNHARESAVWAFLRGLGVQNGRKHVITCRYLSQRYLDSLRVPDSDPVQYDFVWGPRARLETSKMKALRYVARIHRKEPEDWPEQYREAMEDEANRAEAGRRPLIVRNLR